MCIIVIACYHMMIMMMTMVILSGERQTVLTVVASASFRALACVMVQRVNTAATELTWI